MANFLAQLQTVADESLNEIRTIVAQQGSTAVLDSIKEQMHFISEWAGKGEDPRNNLNGNSFTFAILASRELSAPNEEALKQALSIVTQLFIEHPKM